MSQNAERFYVFTGGPGSGKSSLIAALHQRGYAHSIEAGRGIIRDQAALGGDGLPWRNAVLFAELMLSSEMRSYRLAEESPGIVFFDRGVPDVLGYLRVVGQSPSAYMKKAAKVFRYNRKVFIVPPWPEIFRQDRERKQDFEEAVRTYDAMVETYAALDYQLVEIPCSPIEDRVRLVLDHLAV